MKVKRITIEIEVPMRTITAEELQQVVVSYLEDKRVPHQSQVSYDISPNTKIGNVTEYSEESYSAGTHRYIQPVT